MPLYEVAVNRMGWCAVVAIALLIDVGRASVQAGAGTERASGEQTGEAIVTFYSAGSWWKLLDVGREHGIFHGCIYEVKQEVACLQFPGFVSLRLPVGVHVFSASLSERHGATNSQTPVLLEAGAHYFLRAEVNTKKFAVVPVLIPPFGGAVPTTLHPRRGRLDVVTCEVAHQETANARPMPPKYIDKSLQGSMLDDMPACPAPAAPAAKP